MLILIRHGESTMNAEGKLVGRLDPSLTPTGEAQAARAGATLAAVNELIVSPLTRTRQTASLLGVETPMRIDERVIELDYGVFDGTRLGEVDPSLWARWHEEADFAPEGGESLVDLRRRLSPLLEELFAAPGQGARSKEGDVVIVSHVSPIKAAVAWALGTDDLVAWRMRLSNGSVTRIGYGPTGPQLLSFNETPPD